MQLSTDEVVVCNLGFKTHIKYTTNLSLTVKWDHYVNGAHALNLEIIL
jgi:hypothetical protein